MPLPAGRAATILHFDLPYAAMIEAESRFKDARAAAKAVMKRFKDSGVGLSRRQADGSAENLSEEAAAQELEGMWQRVRDAKSAEHRVLRLLGVA